MDAIMNAFLSPPALSPSRHVIAQTLALHATLSKIIAAVINEGLGQGVFDIMGNRGTVLPLDCTFDNFTSSRKIVFPLTWVPRYAEAVEGHINFLRIIDIDPQDIPLQFPLQYHIIEEGGTASAINNAAEAMRVIQAWTNVRTSGFDDLMVELMDCLQNSLIKYLNPPLMPTLESDYLTWEQSLVDGHSTHPMFLSRCPLSQDVGPLPLEQIKTCILHFYLIEAERVILTGEYAAEIRPLTDAANVIVPPGFVAVPVHEYQLKYLATTDLFKNITVLQETCAAKVQSSLRTVTPWDVASNSPLLAHMAIKLPIAIRKTSALRTISPWSTTISNELNSHWPRMSAIDSSILHICYERAGLSLRHEDFDIAKHVACIIREDATRWINPGESVALCAALFQSADGGWSDDKVVVRAWGLNTKTGRTEFLQNYVDLFFRCFLPPLIEHGFCFDAHGQNALIHYEIATGKLLGFSIRDFAGVRIWQPAMESSTGHRVSLISNNCNEVSELRELHAKAFHGFIQAHLYPLIRALDMHHDRSGWKIVRTLLEKYLPDNCALRKDWLETRTASFKCFLSMRIGGKYRDYVYKDTPNLLELGREVYVS